MATLTELATTLAPKAFSNLEAELAGSVANALELVLLEKGFADEAAAAAAGKKAECAYALAYNVILAALDLARGKVLEAKGGPAEAKFRQEEKYLEAVLKRVARKAGIREEGDVRVNPAPFVVEQFPPD